MIETSESTYDTGSSMMTGYGMSHYGGAWLPLLLVIMVVGVMAWIVMQKKK